MGGRLVVLAVAVVAFRGETVFMETTSRLFGFTDRYRGVIEGNGSKFLICCAFTFLVLITFFQKGFFCNVTLVWVCWSLSKSY